MRHSLFLYAFHSVNDIQAAWQSIPVACHLHALHVVDARSVCGHCGLCAVDGCPCAFGVYSGGGVYASCCHECIAHLYGIEFLHPLAYHDRGAFNDGLCCENTVSIFVCKHLYDACLVFAVPVEHYVVECGGLYQVLRGLTFLEGLSLCRLRTSASARRAVHGSDDGTAGGLSASG